MTSPTTYDDTIESLRENHSKSDLIDFFEQFDEQSSLSYVLAITQLVEKVPGVETTLEEVLTDPEYESTHRFSAFYGLCVFARRNKEISYLQNLHDEHQSRFEEYPLYHHLYGVFLRERGRERDFRQAIDHMEQTLNAVNDNPAIHKAVANTWITALERNVEIQSPAEMRRQARKHIQRAIDLWPEYGEYHLDLGRLYAEEGNFEKAERAIHDAIDLEDRDKENYAMRLADYQYHLSQVRVKRIQAELDDEFESVRDELQQLEQEADDLINRFQSIVLQSLAFFAGIITIVITSVQVALQMPLVEASQLILLLTGGLLVAFSGLSLVLPGDIKRSQVLTAGGLGAGIIAISAVYGIILGF